jgi:histidine ammonia-lyase
VHALRRLAVPSTIGSIETSGGQEDVQSFAWAAATGLRAALRHARVVAACELLTAWQAAALAAAAGEPRIVSGGAASLVAAVSERVKPIEADRPLGPDI